MTPPPPGPAAALPALAVTRPETDWPGYLAWTAGLLLLVALAYWLMRQAWTWRGRLQGDLPELPADPDPQAPARRTMTGRYHGTTTAGQWLDRIVAHGLGSRSRAELALTEHGLRVGRPGAADFFIPAHRLRDARLDKAIAGKVLTEGALLIVTWRHGDRLLDSGFRADQAGTHAAWAEALRAAARPEPTDGTADAAVQPTREQHPKGAR